MPATTIRLLALLALAVHFATLAFAITVDTCSENYPKGENVCVTGSCEPGIIEISINSLGRDVLTKNIHCTDGNFELNYLTRFSDPSGVWTVTAKAIDVEGTPTVEKTVRVSQVRESQFFLITFLSPSKDSYFRTEAADITARVTDAGVPIEGADVFTWLPNGNKTQIPYAGNGIYSLGYVVKPNDNLGTWKLTVTTENQNAGGENSMSILVKKAPIAIDLIEPAGRSFDVGSDIPVKLKASYLDGSAPQQASAVADFDGKRYELANIGNGEFEQAIKTFGAVGGAKSLEITLVDAFGNEGHKKIDLALSESVFSLASGVWPYIIAMLAVTLIILFVVRPKMRLKKETKGIENRANELEDKIKKIQKDYFQKGAISKQIYTKKLSAFEAELAEARKKLKIQ